MLMGVAGQLINTNLKDVPHNVPDRVWTQDPMEMVTAPDAIIEARGAGIHDSELIRKDLHPNTVQFLEPIFRYFKMVCESNMPFPGFRRGPGGSVPRRRPFLSGRIRTHLKKQAKALEGVMDSSVDTQVGVVASTDTTVVQTGVTKDVHETSFDMKQNHSPGRTDEDMEIYESNSIPYVTYRHSSASYAGISAGMNGILSRTSRVFTVPFIMSCFLVASCLSTAEGVIVPDKLKKSHRFVDLELRDESVKYTNNRRGGANMPGKKMNRLMTTLNNTMTDDNIADAAYLWVSDNAAALDAYGDISLWDTSSVTNMEGLFYGLDTFNDDISQWDTSQVTSMSFMFGSDFEYDEWGFPICLSSSSFNGDVSQWDTSSVADMYGMFLCATSFNGDVSTWDTGSVTSMRGMFYIASSFNGDVSDWDTSHVTSMRSMFVLASSFNGDVSKWNTSSVNSMLSMFSDTYIFNGDVSKWDTSSVTSMAGMFQWAYAFNGDVSKFDTSSVTDIYGLASIFLYATSFNGDVSKWDTSRVVDIRYAFWGASSFNGDVSKWDTSSVENMEGMFGSDPPCAPYAFNGDVSKWDTSSVTAMAYMFTCASSFNRALSKWDTSSVTDMTAMFGGASSFNGKLTKWNTGLVMSMSKMFYYANSFDQVLCWNTSQLVMMEDMFTGSSGSFSSDPYPECLPEAPPKKGKKSKKGKF
jgi:surface protein